jgi:hypothetical protein
MSPRNSYDIMMAETSTAVPTENSIAAVSVMKKASRDSLQLDLCENLSASSQCCEARMGTAHKSWPWRILPLIGQAAIRS